MDRIEDLLQRIRDSRQLAAVLFYLADVHRELGGEPGLLAALVKRPTIVKGSGPWKSC